jgi:hypothetical protein
MYFLYRANTWLCEMAPGLVKLYTPVNCFLAICNDTGSNLQWKWGVKTWRRRRRRRREREREEEKSVTHVGDREGCSCGKQAHIWMACLKNQRNIEKGGQCESISKDTHSVNTVIELGMSTTRSYLEIFVTKFRAHKSSEMGIRTRKINTLA